MIDPKTFDKRMQKTFDTVLENISNTPLKTHLRAAFGCWVALIIMFVLFRIAAQLGAALGPGLFIMMSASLITIWLVSTYYKLRGER